MCVCVCVCVKPQIDHPNEGTAWAVSAWQARVVLSMKKGVHIKAGQG